MSPASRRLSAAPLILLAAATALSLSACISPPPLPSAPPQPTATGVTDPIETSPAPVPTPSTEPTAGGADLPDLVAIGTELAPGTQAGWETSILSTDGFEPQADSTFPAGPTISVLETATGCTFWAYQGQQDGESTDETENSNVTLGIISESSPDDWEADVFPLEESASQGVAVEFLSIISERDDGTAHAWYARNFQSSGTTSSIMAHCPADVGGVDHIDEVVLEHLQINFLQP
ncbi:hypothetical protein [Agrococcus sp. ARC_14]|uniref:hypothetical protein n=1 Tax=Agrococcus sp. ARC_14 TaxID=2919927 RepID=UPI001F0667BB|nr:hypothetical protein [Agrococcus sp. ARC_14]MCH1882966.1 hypothetical protein [Agrococcus sp. ARC_14]